jgi:hypothetical protein
MSKKKKFDLTNLVHHGHLKDGETLHFLSDPSQKAVVTKQPNGEFKLTVGEETMTVHSAAVKFLGTEPPDHACRWLRNAGGTTLYEMWQKDIGKDLEEAM